MRKHLFILTFLITSFLSRSQSVITIQHGSTTQTANTFDSAIIKAQTGDFIYLPGGLISSSQNITITKKLSILGSGYNPDSSTATDISTITCNIQFDPGSEGSYISGITSGSNTNIYLNTSSITVSRTSILDIILLANNANNLLVEENVLRGSIGGNGQSQSFSNVLFNKNIVYGHLYNLQNSPGIVFANNIFMLTMFYETNCVFKNNIFLNTSVNFANVNTFSNNLFVANSVGWPSGSFVSNNILNVDTSKIFVQYNPTGQWSPKFNFHLKSNSPGKNAATDGKDIGLYGTSVPFKEGGIPFNPHIQSANIANTTNASNKLTINITVTAQDH